MIFQGIPDPDPFRLCRAMAGCGTNTSMRSLRSLVNP